MSDLKDIVNTMQLAIQEAFLEGAEAMYVAILSQPTQKMTFTHHRGDVALKAWKDSVAKQNIKV